MACSTASKKPSKAPLLILTTDSIQDVFEAMFEARDKWRNIGGTFRVPDSTLSCIAQEEDSADDRLRRVIRAWRDGGTAACTWAVVAETLRNKTVGRDDLAQEVEEKYLKQISQASTTSSSQDVAVEEEQVVQKPMCLPTETHIGLESKQSEVTVHVSPIPQPHANETMLTTNDILKVSIYLTPLTKVQMKTLGQLLGLRPVTVNDTYDGSTKSSYLDSVLTAWLNQQDNVIKEGGPYWSVLVKALENDLLGHSGIASKIQKERN